MRIINGERLPTVTDRGIYGFFGEYRFLSNFHVLTVPIEVNGLVFWSSEAAYMAEKTHVWDIKLQLANISATPNKAKKLGRELPLRSDWEDVKDEAMLTMLRAKFLHDPILGNMLLETNGHILEETNNWGDAYWGAVVDPEGFPGKGHNKLGQMLMEVRYEVHPKLLSF